MNGLLNKVYSMARHLEAWLCPLGQRRRIVGLTSVPYYDSITMQE
jgi:hypothetical protein